MATFQLIHGATTVDLDSSSGFQWQRGGITGGKATSLQSGPVQETYAVKLNKSASANAAATTLQNLVKVLNAVENFRESTWEKNPVYLKAQATGESNARYALVRQMRAFTPPEVLGNAFDQNKILTDIMIEIEREHPWGDKAPFTFGSAIALTATDGPASPTMVHVANFRDNSALTHVFHYDDSATTFGSNLLTAADGTALWPAAPAASDILYFGSTDIAWKHACLEVATAGAFSWAITWEYWNGSAWTAMVFGTDFTLFAAAGGEVASDDVPFNEAGLWAINIFPPSDWAKTTINSQDAFWVRARLTTVTSTTTVPTKNGDDIYSQAGNHVVLPSSALAGDSAMPIAIRLWSASGGATDPGPANLSRILMGAKSRGLTNFIASLNLGGLDNPAAWSQGLGTDASNDSDNASPGGQRVSIDFSSTATEAARVTLTGNNILSDFEGDYRAFVVCQQIGGSAGDVKVRLRTYLGADDDSYPNIDTPQKKTNAADMGPEVLDMGLLRLPFSRAFAADSLTNVDLIFKVLAERVSGSSTLRLYSLFLLPVDEWTAAVDDMAADISNGNTSLKGGNVLDLDGGLIGMRAQRYIYDGSTMAPADPWDIMGRPPKLKNVGVATNIYFLMLSYSASGSWGQEPLVAREGMHLAVEVFGRSMFAVLRGSS